LSKKFLVSSELKHPLISSALDSTCLCITNRLIYLILLSVADDELQQFYASFAAAVELFPAATVHQEVDVRSSDDSERVFLQVPGGSGPQLVSGVYRMELCSAVVFNVVI
jgi:hypothetical protein